MNEDRSHSQHIPSPMAQSEKDPVCGMKVNPATSKHAYEHEGKKYYFCCGGCVEKFKVEPGRYLSKPAPTGLVTLGRPTKGRTTIESGSRKAETERRVFYVCPMCPEIRESRPVPCPSCGMALEPETPLTDTRMEYTCPMHPEIVRPEPGSCPICGMALEPRTVVAQVENPELGDMTRRFWVSVVLTAPLLAIAMGSMIWPHGFMQALAGWRLPWLELLMASPVVLWCGLPFFQRFWTSL